MLEDFDQTLAKLRPFLKAYLESHGIDCSKHFRCLDPNHQDNRPSCHIIPGREDDLAYCFGCARDFDIFDAAHLLEGKPISGPGFVSDNVLYLAEKFGIEVDLRPLTEEEQYRLDTYRAYADAAEIICSFEPTPRVLAECQARGWDVEELKTLKVGWVSSFQEYRRRMAARGWDPEFLNDVDLGLRNGKPSPIFAKDTLIFTICDEHGRPCGFAARNLNYDPNRDRDRKFCNTATSLKCDIYQKSRRLYGLHLARRYQPPLYVVEGYADWVTLYLHGVKNVAALGGVAFTDQHVDLLLNLGIRHLVFALDGDPAGQQRMEKIIERYLIGRKDLNIEVVSLPEGLDPDDLVRRHGIQAWQELVPVSAFAWRLDRFDGLTDPQDIAETMLPYIVNEPLAIRRERMLRELMGRTGFTYKSLEQDLERLLNAKEAARLGRKEEIIEQALRRARRNPDDAVLIFQDAICRFQEVDQAYDHDKLSAGEFTSFLALQYEREQSKAAEPEGFRLGPDLQPVEPMLEGGDIFTALGILGGVNNAGKTNLLSKLAVSIAQYNPDATVIIHTIDDNREKFVTRLAMQVLGDDAGDIELNWLKNPNYYCRFDSGLHLKHKLAYERLQALAEDERLVVKDVQLGANLTVIESILAYYRRRLPQRKLVFFLDNFSLLDMLAGDQDHVRVRQTMKEFKRLLGKYRVFALATMEYTKMEPWERPTYNKLRGTGGAGFDPDLIMHIYNDMRAYGQQSKYFHLDRHGNRLPTIEWIFDKNKVNGHAGKSVFLDMWPVKAQFRYVSEAEMKQRLAALGEESEPRPRLQFHKGQQTVNAVKGACYGQN